MASAREIVMSESTEAKITALRQQGVLNPRPLGIIDPSFQDSDFFDRHDLLQVKYEMLRRVRVDGWSVWSAAESFGFSRPVFYQAQAAYASAGLPGLIPQRPGPRQAHKLSEEVVDYLLEQILSDSSLRTPALSRLIRQRFDLAVHPRSIERALARRRKKGR
jgi:transposase